MNEPTLRVQGITRRHGALEVVSNASFDLAPGEWLSLVGPSGCGKTSLLLTIGLLDRPTAGRVLLDGEDAWAHDSETRARLRRERIGFVFQQNNLLGSMTARDNVALPAWRATGSRKKATDAADDLLERFGLGRRAHAPASVLSAGEAQRVAIARALVNRPRVVLADEPTGSLDSSSGDRILAALDDVRARGASLLVVTHDPRVACRGQRTLSMRDGRIVEDGAA